MRRDAMRCVTRDAREEELPEEPSWLLSRPPTCPDERASSYASAAPLRGSIKARQKRRAREREKTKQTGRSAQLGSAEAAQQQAERQ